MDTYNPVLYVIFYNLLCVWRRKLCVKNKYLYKNSRQKHIKEKNYENSNFYN